MQIRPYAGFKLTIEELDGDDILLDEKVILLKYFENNMQNFKLIDVDFTAINPLGEIFKVKIKDNGYGIDSVNIEQEKGDVELILKKFYQNGSCKNIQSKKIH